MRLVSERQFCLILKNRAERGINHYREDPYGQSDRDKRLRYLTQLRRQLDAVQVVKITASMTVL